MENRKSSFPSGLGTQISFGSKFTRTKKSGKDTCPDPAEIQSILNKIIKSEEEDTKEGE